MRHFQLRWEEIISLVTVGTCTLPEETANKVCSLVYLQHSRMNCYFSLLINLYTQLIQRKMKDITIKHIKD